MVPALSIVLIITNMLLGIIIPVGLVVFFRKKYQASAKSFFVGCAVMLLFALVLEQMVHMVVLGSGVGTAIRRSTWAYALYGALMAGLFEETGRFLAMRYVLKKEHGNAHNALMYGAGHGGFEMFVILSMGMVNNLIYALMININMGQTQTLLASLDEVSKNTLQTAFDTLIQTPSWQFALSPVERIAAITAQIGLSVIVWFAAEGEKSRMSLWFLAIALHALLDGVAVVTSRSGMSLIAVEALVWVMTVGIVFVAVNIWKKMGE